MATQACAKSKLTNVEKEKERISSVVCSRTKLADVETALASLGLVYHVSNTEHQLNSIKRYNEDQLVSSAVAVKVRFTLDGNVTSCDVSVLYTGP
jgi:hypothetical protein